MFHIDRNNLPVVLTRKALLVIDLQNDIVSEGGIISVEDPPGFVENSINLAVHFRQSGHDVIWVQSGFEGSRPVNSDNRRSESVITDRELAQVLRASAAEPTSRAGHSQELVEMYSRMVNTDDDLEQLSELQLGGDRWEGPNDETFLTAEHGQSAKFVLPGTPGADFTPLVRQNIDNSRDLIFHKSYYSAFKDGILVQTLRVKFVTEIYICGALTNISIFATAMDAARHGYSIAIVEDCLGYQSRERHDAALMKLTELTGCDILSSMDVHRDLPPGTTKDEQIAPPRTRPHQKGPSLAPRKPAADPARHISPLATSGSTKSRLSNGNGKHEYANSSEDLPGPSKRREQVKTKIKVRRRSSRSPPQSVSKPGKSSPTSRDTSAAVKPLALLEDIGAGATITDKLILKLENADNSSERAAGSPMHLDDRFKAATEATMERETEVLCEGDTTIINNVLDEELSNGVFDVVRDEVLWQKMSHRGGEVPRLIAVQGEVADDGSMPIYRHPSDESPPLLPFSPVVSQIRAVVEKKLGHSLNHVLIQFYRDGNDYISEHSDKTLDIAPNTYIANVSLGAQRTMVFRTKKDAQGKDVSDNSGRTGPRKACKAPLPHNSMCKMGLVTNMRWLHGIRQDKRMSSDKSEAELAYNGGRISLTFRLIGTFISKDEQTIWGQGATGKTKDDAKQVINGETPDTERMVRAFGKENHSSEFDWAETYGEGFDVLHMSNLPKLFPSGDIIADLALKFILAEYGVAWVEGNHSPFFRWSDYPSTTEASVESRTVKFIDNDVEKSTVEGDMAVLYYIDAVYGPKLAKSRDDFARLFTRTHKACDLLYTWRGMPQTIDRFKDILDLWEGFASEGPFLAGLTPSPVDFAVTPLLIELKRAWPVSTRFINLDAYVVRMIDRECVKKVVGCLSHLNDQNTASSQAASTVHAEGCLW